MANVKNLKPVRSKRKIHRRVDSETADLKPSINFTYPGVRFNFVQIHII